MEGESGCRLENVQMAGHNGGALIACLQISHRLPLSHTKYVPPLRSAVEPVCSGPSPAPLPRSRPINHVRGHLKSAPRNTVSTRVVWADTVVELCMLSTDYLCFPLCPRCVMSLASQETQLRTGHRAQRTSRIKFFSLFTRCW